MYKFRIPLRKGIELEPYRNYPMPVIKVNAHVQKLAEKQNMQELASKVQRIVDNNHSQIIQYCAARRQEYSLNTSRVEKKTYQFNQLTLTHKIYFEQEIIEIDVYPDAGIPEEKDPLCLMIVFNDTVWAIPMEQLANPEALSVVYKKQLTNTALGTEYPWQSTTYIPYRQYKFVDAEIGFLLCGVEFSEDRMEVAPIAVYLTPVSKKLDFSQGIGGYAAGIFGAINGAGQKVYWYNGDYEYTETEVTKIAEPTYTAMPYAIDSTGVRYFGGFAGSTYPGFVDFGNLWAVQSGVQVSIFHPGTVQSDGGLTTKMYEDYYDKYIAIAGNGFQSPGIQLGASYGTVPSDNITVEFSYYPGPDNSTPFPISPNVPYRIDIPPDGSPIESIELSIPHPVFSTGKKEGEEKIGDRIELVPISYQSTSKVDWFFYAKSYFPPDPPFMPDGGVGGDYGRDTTVTVNFGPVSYSAKDYARKTTTSSIAPGNGNLPNLYVYVHTDFPVPGGLMYTTARSSRAHYSSIIEEIVDTDFYSSMSVYPGDGGTVSSGEESTSFEDIGHVSNGKDYIQAFYVYPNNNIDDRMTKVYCNGKEIYSVFEALGITEWNFMVMDVLLSRIKKFT